MKQLKFFKKIIIGLIKFHIQIGLISWFLFFVNCNNNSTDSNSQSVVNIIGNIIDFASGQGLNGTIVKIVNKHDAYQTTTGIGGAFSFQNIQEGEYLLSTTTNQNGEVLIDTCGNYDTNNPDWGSIYSRTFVSITGRIILEGENDNSFIKIELLGTDKSALTTNQGNFRIDFIFPDIYDLFISKDENYSTYQIKDIDLEAGEIYKVDTLLTYKYRPLNLREATEINLPYLPISGFAFVGGKYYYGKSILGLFEYNPNSGIESLIYSHYYLGDPAVISDYSDGIWASGDEATSPHMHRKYSLTQQVIVDSIPISISFFSYQGSIAWDPLNNYLVGHSWGTDIYLYSISTQLLKTVTPNLEYNMNLYSSIHFNEILIDESGQVYTIVRLVPYQGLTQNHLYVFNNTTDFEKVQIYKFQQDLPNYQKLSYKEGGLYMIISNKIYQLIL